MSAVGSSPNKVFEEMSAQKCILCVHTGGIHKKRFFYLELELELTLRPISFQLAQSVVQLETLGCESDQLKISDRR